MNQTEERVTESLSKTELSRIRKMMSGYGMFKKTAAKTGLAMPTFRDIINKGYGYPENVQRIRESLLVQ